MYYLFARLFKSFGTHALQREQMQSHPKHARAYIKQPCEYQIEFGTKQAQ